MKVFCICQLIIVLLLKCTSSSRHRNVLMIMVDDLRPALGCYGDKKALTPNIDALAKSSFIFTHAYAQQAVCAPSRNSMLTGRRPDTIRLYDFYSYWRNVAGNYTTLPEYLKSNGYETRSVGKVFHPGVTSNFTDDYPYSWSSDTFHPKTEEFMNKAVCVDPAYGHLKKNLICPVDIETQPFKTLPDLESLQEAKRILNESRSKPFFLAVGFHKPHIPFRIPSKYFGYHEFNKFHKPQFNAIPYELPPVAFNPFVDIRNRDDARMENISFPFGPIPDQFGLRIRHAYYSAVTFIDDIIGDLLNHTNLQDTIVILLGDHGWSLGEHADWAKYSNFDVAVRIPLIIHSPGHKLKKTKFLTNIVELLDLFPTIVELTELQLPSTCQQNPFALICVEGKSLLPLFNKTPTNNDHFSAAFSQYPRPGSYPTERPNSDKPRLEETNIMGYSVKTKQFRYTVWVEFNHTNFQINWNQIYGTELYDHSFDSDENLNLADRNELKTIQSELEQLLKNNFH